MQSGTQKCLEPRQPFCGQPAQLWLATTKSSKQRGDSSSSLQIITGRFSSRRDIRQQRGGGARERREQPQQQQQQPTKSTTTQPRGSPAKTIDQLLLLLSALSTSLPFLPAPLRSSTMMRSFVNNDEIGWCCYQKPPHLSLLLLPPSFSSPHRVCVEAPASSATGDVRDSFPAFPSPFSFNKTTFSLSSVVGNPVNLRFCPSSSSRVMSGVI